MALFYGLIVYYSPNLASLFDTILLTSLVIIGWLFILIGFALHTINRRFAELTYLLKKRENRDF
jgi:hypothetical protein